MKHQTPRPAAALLVLVLVFSTPGAEAEWQRICAAEKCDDLERICLGGEVRYPNPDRSCAFYPPCPEDRNKDDEGRDGRGGGRPEPLAPDDIGPCSDLDPTFLDCGHGKYVYRDADNGCEFFPCDGGHDIDPHDVDDPALDVEETEGAIGEPVSAVGCAGPERLCPDGETMVGPDPYNGCEYTNCPEDEGEEGQGEKKDKGEDDQGEDDGPCLSLSDNWYDLFTICEKYCNECPDLIARKEEENGKRLRKRVRRQLKHHANLKDCELLAEAFQLQATTDGVEMTEPQCD